MEVFVVEILVESTDLNSCSTEVFSTFEKAEEYASREIALYADDYDGEVTEDCKHRKTMQSGDQYVTIEIHKKVVNYLQ